MTIERVKFMLLHLMLSWIVAQQAGGEPQPPYAVAQPLDRPVVFADGVVTTRNGIALSDDGHTLYTSNTVPLQFENGRSYAKIFVSRFVGGRWSEPQSLDWEWELDAYHPVLSSDNQRLFFNSRSHPDSGNESVPHSIWVAPRTASGWGWPRMVGSVNSPSADSYPSLARNDNLYFNSDRPDGLGGMDIYVAHYVEGAYLEPVNVRPLNSAHAENDLVVDPDERFIIFNRYFDATGEIDLFVAFREGERWSTPVPLESVNQAERWELTPSLSPDGRYFFFEVDTQILQVELDAVLGRKRR